LNRHLPLQGATYIYSNTTTNDRHLHSASTAYRQQLTEQLDCAIK
jgi:hypothetical protein